MSDVNEQHKIKATTSNKANLSHQSLWKASELEKMYNNNSKSVY